MSEPLILTSQQGAVRTLTLNRPAALNSFTAQMNEQLRSQLDAAAADPAVRCVVLTGRGRGCGAGRIGLIWKCVADATLAEEVDKLAQKLSTMPAKALAATREVFDAAQHLTLEQALDAEAQVQGQLGRAHDYLEGVAAFSAKRA